jgi:hypothetical protein
MSWCWIEPSITTVDFFRFLSPPPPPPSRVADTRLRRAAAIVVESAANPERYSPDQILQEERTVERNKGLLVEQAVANAEAALLESAPQVPVLGLGRGWIGEWIDVRSPESGERMAVLLFQLHAKLLFLENLSTVLLLSVRPNARLVWRSTSQVEPW